MNAPLLIANILTFLGVIAHIFIADKEIKIIEPLPNSDNWITKQQKWTMVRGAFHLVTVDSLCLTIVLGVINFTDLIPVGSEQIILKFLALYMLLLACCWLIVLSISKQFTKIYFKLWQWTYFIITGGLIYLGTI